MKIQEEIHTLPALTKPKVQLCINLTFVEQLLIEEQAAIPVAARSDTSPSASPTLKLME
jgi:hypothetical protein